MSDLQCPARFLVVAAPGTVRPEPLAESLRHERVAAVYDAPPHADEARALAGALGLPLHDMTRRLTLAEVAAQSPGALDVLRDLADLHRGETVVVVGEGPAGRRVDVSVDGDGVAVTQVSPEGAT
ncbi:MAG TPA: hypothetical protein VFR87_12245 [Nocardioidaceae bacterium]|nr:hypothetical protein [Nocardioidaceae bacterium]